MQKPENGKNSWTPDFIQLYYRLLKKNGNLIFPAANLFDRQNSR